MRHTVYESTPFSLRTCPAAPARTRPAGFTAASDDGRKPGGASDPRWRSPSGIDGRVRSRAAWARGGRRDRILDLPLHLCLHRLDRRGELARAAESPVLGEGADARGSGRARGAQSRAGASRRACGGSRRGPRAWRGLGASSASRRSSSSRAARRARRRSGWRRARSRSGGAPRGGRRTPRASWGTTRQQRLHLRLEVRLELGRRLLEDRLGARAHLVLHALGQHRAHRAHRSSESRRCGWKSFLRLLHRARKLLGASRAPAAGDAAAPADAAPPPPPTPPPRHVRPERRLLQQAEHLLRRHAIHAAPAAAGGRWPRRAHRGELREQRPRSTPRRLLRRRAGDSLRQRDVPSRHHRPSGFGRCCGCAGEDCGGCIGCAKASAVGRPAAACCCWRSCAHSAGRTACAASVAEALLLLPWSCRREEIVAFASVRSSAAA